MEYISGEKKKNCIFCDELTRPDGSDNLVLHRGKYVFVILNRYPYTSGHLMVVPFMHQASLDELNPEIRSVLLELSVVSMKILRQEYHPQGFNIGINIGEVAGAGIIDHVHLHVVPRWSGDTNFMSTLSDTRVLPEALSESYWRVKKAWDLLNQDQ
jgi:ATP adenylyltransferase